MYLSPCLFNQNNPELRSISLAECWAAILYRNPFINYYICPLSIFANLYAINTKLVKLLMIILEQFGYPV